VDIELPDGRLLEIEVSGPADGMRAVVTDRAGRSKPLFTINARPVPLTDVEGAWRQTDGGQRIVITHGS
jgi:hypothetical protein